MKIIKVDLEDDKANIDFNAILWQYNAIDCHVTHGILKRMQQTIKRKPKQQETYEFIKDLQIPLLEMGMRGVRVDLLEKSSMIISLNQEQQRIRKLLNTICFKVFGFFINANSTPDLKKLFYSDKGLQLQPEKAFKNGVSRESTNRQCLEKLKEKWLDAIVFVNLILTIKEITKTISVLRSKITKDGRMTTTYKVAGTNTGRLSSAQSQFNIGMNLQNPPPKIRHIFIPEKGKKLAYLDLQRAESWIVGLLVAVIIGDYSYLNVIKTGDLHTMVARMVWPHLNWGEKKNWRKIADIIFYRTFSYRDMAKGGGHGTNYLGSAFMLAMHLQVSYSIMQQFQHSYFKKSYH